MSLEQHWGCGALPTDPRDIRIKELEKQISELEEMLHVKTPTVMDISMAACSHFGCSMSELRSDKRGEGISKVRQIIYWLARTLVRHPMSSYPNIGRYLNRDHTAVMYGAREIEIERHTDVLLASDLYQISRRFMGLPDAPGVRAGNQPRRRQMNERYKRSRADANQRHA